MPLVTGQTVPFDNSALELEDTSRWSRLFPRIRPSVVSVSLPNGDTILIDTSFATISQVKVVASGTVDILSSSFLSRRDACAFVLQSAGSRNVPSSEDIAKALINQGFDLQRGLVTLSTGTENSIKQEAPQPYYLVEMVGEFLMAHILALLGSTAPQTSEHIQEMAMLIVDFSRHVKSTMSVFNGQKSGSLATIRTSQGPVPFESARLAIKKDVEFLLGPEKGPTGLFTFSAHLTEINGLSKLEQLILAHEISEVFDDRNLGISLTSSSLTDTAIPARGWIISSSSIPSKWLSPPPKPLTVLEDQSSSIPQSRPLQDNPHIKFTDIEVRQRITRGCKEIIEAEPTITEYDTIVGDGDCGFTLRDGATRVLSFIEDKDLASLSSVISALVDDLEVSMGGTSGALYCIFLSALAQDLSTAKTLPEALSAAQDHLLRYTKARLGDRTMLDCLIPFVDTWTSTADVMVALDAARNGVDGTKSLEAKLGRSTYLDEAATQGVPDPGAYGLLKLLEGMVGAK